MMEEGELPEDWPTMDWSSLLEKEGTTTTSFNNRVNFISKKDSSSLSRVNSRLKEETKSLNWTNSNHKKEERVNSKPNQKERKANNDVSLVSKEESSSYDLVNFKEKRLNPMLNPKERIKSYFLKRNLTEGKTGSSANNGRQEKSPFSKANLIFKKEKSYDLIEATSLFETKSSLTDAPISFFATNPLLKEKGEEEQEDKMDPFEKSFLLLNVTSCCLANLPGHSARRKRPDLKKPPGRQRAFSSSRRRPCTDESRDQSPDQSLQVRERPKSPLPGSLQSGPLPGSEVRMQELLSKPWSLFICLLLLLPRMAICDIPRCNPENMGDNPFCIPLDYNKVRKVLEHIISFVG